MKLLAGSLIFLSLFFSYEYSDLLNLLNKYKINLFLRIEVENKVLNIINVERYKEEKGDKLLFFVDGKKVYEYEGEFGAHILFIKEEYIYGSTYIFTEWTWGIYAQTIIYYYNGKNIKKIFDFRGHIENSYIMFNEEEGEVQLIIPCKDGHAMPTDTYIYKYDKQSNKFVLKRIIKRDIKEEDDPQIIERKR